MMESVLLQFPVGAAPTALVLDSRVVAATPPLGSKMAQSDVSNLKTDFGLRSSSDQRTFGGRPVHVPHHGRQDALRLGRTRRTRGIGGAPVTMRLAPAAVERSVIV